MRYSIHTDCRTNLFRWGEQILRTAYFYKIRSTCHSSYSITFRWITLRCNINRNTDRHDFIFFNLHSIGCSKCNIKLVRIFLSCDINRNSIYFWQFWKVRNCLKIRNSHGTDNTALSLYGNVYFFSVKNLIGVSPFCKCILIHYLYRNTVKSLRNYRIICICYKKPY